MIQIDHTTTDKKRVILLRYVDGDKETLEN